MRAILVLFAAVTLTSRAVIADPRPRLDAKAFLSEDQPDGFTDNTLGVQAAIDAAHAAGGADVDFAPGTYVIAKIRLYEHVTVRGAGRETTVFRARSRMVASDRLSDDGGPRHLDYQAVVMFYNAYGKPLDGIGLRDLTIDGNARDQTYDGARNLHGFYLNGVSNALIENVTAKNCLGFGGILKEATHSTVQRSSFDGNGQNLKPGFWRDGTPPGGDGLDLMSRCVDNTVADSSATGNLSCGFEDEGRLGAYNPVNRNARNRWVNLVAKDNGDNGLTLLWADGPQVVDFSSTGGARGPNSAAIQLLGTSDATLDGISVTGAAHDGIRIWPEVYGVLGINRRVTIRRTTIASVAGRGIVLEGVEGGSVQATIRGVGGGVAVDLSAVGYGRTEGYGRGRYRAGVKYTARSASPSGVGDFVLSAANVYELVTPFKGSGVSVTAPSGTGSTSDNGGTWAWRNGIASRDVELLVDYDGSVGTRATYGIYAQDPVHLTIRDSAVTACRDHNIWLDGTPVDPALVNTRSSASGAKGLAVPNVEGTLRISRLRLEGNAREPSYVPARTVFGETSIGIGPPAPGRTFAPDAR